MDVAGSYNGDVCKIKPDSLTIQGINGRPHIDAAGAIADGKAIWVIKGDNVTVENIEFSGAVDTSANGAGIRFEGKNLTVRNCYFHDNQEGMLTSTEKIGDILIEYSEFAYNGKGDGQSHNLYINHADSFTFQYCYSHHAKIGHLLKSRSKLNYILYNRFSDEAAGTASYEIDLPSGGTSYVIGNVIEQGPNSPNNILLSYMEEAGNPRNKPNSKHDLYVVNNTFVNEQSVATFVYIDPSVSPAAVIQNNIFAGAGVITTQARAKLISNLSGVDPLFADPANYNYTLMPLSPAIGAGTQPTSGTSFPLSATSQYLHAACQTARASTGPIDIGAQPFGNAQPILCSSYSSTAGVAAALTLSQSSVVAGTSSTASVTSSQPASGIGLPITFMSSNPAVTETATTTIPAGQSSATVTIPTTWVAGDTTASVFAYGAGSSVTAPLTITPAAANVVGFTQISTSVLTFSVNLSGPAPAGGATVSLSSSDLTLLLPPASVVVPEGALSVQFNVLVGLVLSGTPVTLNGTYNGTTASQNITIGPPSLNWLGLHPMTVKGGQSANLTVALNGIGPIGGILVALSSSDPTVAQVPATIFMVPGSGTDTLSYTTSPVLQQTSVTISASYLGITMSQVLTVTP